MESWSSAIDLRALAERFGTPLYVHHLQTLRANLARWVRLVGEPGRVRYPVKANPSPVVLRTLAEAGCGADCASSVEVQLALGHGVPLEGVSYNTPAFDPQLAAWLLRSGAGVVADSAQALEELAGRIDPAGMAGRLFVRINPGGLPGYQRASEVQRYTDHGSPTSQFGIPSEEVAHLLDHYPLPVTGLHVHVGTQMDNVDTFVEGLAFLHDLADALARRPGLSIEVLNLGGGLGIPFADDQVFPTVDELVDALLPNLRPGMEYHVEPGNALVGDALALLSRVVTVKETRGKRWAIADVGTDQLVKHTIARWEHQILGPDHRPLPRKGPDGLAGPLCFAGDVLLPETELPPDLAPGDPLLVQHAGAYCEAVASHFNGRRAPGQVVVGADGRPRLARQREDVFFQPEQQTFLPGGLEAVAGGGEPEAVEGPKGRAAGAGSDVGEAARAGSGGTAGRGSAPGGVERIDPERAAALGSEYMRRLANQDLFDVREVRRLGPRSYEVDFTLRAGVDFVAMPFAVRLVGDATIIAVGLEMGWTAKPGPVWATRISMTCGKVLPVDGALTCRVDLGALGPSPSPGVQVMALAHYRLGPGSFTGVAQVAVPRADGNAGDPTPPLGAPGSGSTQAPSSRT